MTTYSASVTCKYCGKVLRSTSDKSMGAARAGASSKATYHRAQCDKNPSKK